MRAVMMERQVHHYQKLSSDSAPIGELCIAWEDASRHRDGFELLSSRHGSVKHYTVYTVYCAGAPAIVDGPALVVDGSALVVNGQQMSESRGYNPRQG
ncbi:hypothetical protein E2P81_ATG03094 [Venturia nashicola]|uniref:Uncharacterized protein n=1 Tax=Venturia nashicola TaxID=86259 RepID=A0A4Z1P5Y8_9PEZI|nr:hypothetical protein E6O75_ATG03161 [Venturia nashicola]TLD36205.1 hypothetical protein E2P81_ATG03094 [Venturia nashicola]